MLQTLALAPKIKKAAWDLGSWKKKKNQRYVFHWVGWASNTDVILESYSQQE